MRWLSIGSRSVLEGNGTGEIGTRQRGSPRLKKQIHVDRPVQPCHCVHVPLSVELTAMRVMRTRRPASVKVAVAGAAEQLFSKFRGSACTKSRKSQSRSAFSAMWTAKKCRPWISAEIEPCQGRSILLRISASTKTRNTLCRRLA
jgi:hypothetical protein